MNACIEVNLSSPTRNADGFSKLVTASKVTCLQTPANRDKVREAETLMTDARALLKQLCVPVDKQTTPLGKVDVRSIAYLLGMGRELEGKDYESLAAIAEALIIIQRNFNGI